MKGHAVHSVTYGSHSRQWRWADASVVSLLCIAPGQNKLSCTLGMAHTTNTHQKHVIMMSLETTWQTALQQGWVTTNVISKGELIWDLHYHWLTSEFVFSETLSMSFQSRYKKNVN